VDYTLTDLLIAIATITTAHILPVPSDSYCFLTNWSWAKWDKRL